MESSFLFKDLLKELDKCRFLIKNSLVKDRWVKKTADKRYEIVTNIDLYVEDILKRWIIDKFPNAEIVSEESFNWNFDLDSDCCFVIDPIDGTKELLAGSSNYAISLAILKKGIPVFGIVDFPAIEKRYWSIKGLGAFVNGKKLNSMTNRPKLNQFGVSPAQYSSNEFDDIRNNLNGIKFLPIGSLTSKIEAIICGKIDAAFYLKKEGSVAAIWDYLGISIILEELGGKITDFNGVSLLSKLPIFHKDGWVASIGKYQFDIVKRISRIKKKSTN